MKTLKKITVLYNLPGTSSTINIEQADEDTQKSAKEVFELLIKLGYQAEFLGIKQEDIKKLSELNTDLVFNLVEWTGRELHYGVDVLNILQKHRIKFTGSDANGYKVSSDKIMMKQTLNQEKITTPRWQAYVDGRETMDSTIPYPQIVKPAFEHCGIGVDQNSLVHSESALKDLVIKSINKFGQPVIAEEYIDGREIQVTIFEKDGKPWVLPPAEVTFLRKPGYLPILTYEAKWNDKSDEYSLSQIKIAKLETDLKNKIEEISLLCYEKLGGRDYPRVDMRVRDNEVFVLEINNNPGMGFDTESGIGLSARAVGMNYEQMLQHIVTNAYSRHGTS